MDGIDPPLAKRADSGVGGEREGEGEGALGGGAMGKEENAEGTNSIDSKWRPFLRCGCSNLFCKGGESFKAAYLHSRRLAAETRQRSTRPSGKILTPRGFTGAGVQGLSPFPGVGSKPTATNASTRSRQRREAGRRRPLAFCAPPTSRWDRPDRRTDRIETSEVRKRGLARLR